MRCSLQSLIDSQKKLHPSMGVQDVYKLLFQSSLGPYHIMHHLDHARSELNREFSQIEVHNNYHDILIENISINERVVRINLRPFKAKCDSTEELFTVMRQSVASFNPDREKLSRLWNEFKSLVANSELDFESTEVKIFEETIDPLNDTYITHSTKYKECENPSYRVVLKSIFEKYFPELSPQ